MPRAWAGLTAGHGAPLPRCYRAAMGIPLSESALRLIDGKNYAVLATVNPDGSPQTSVVWVGRDGGDLLMSTVEGRVKHRNMLRDPRVSLTVIDSLDPENYVELRGRVSMTPDVGRQVDTQLSWKYDGKDPGEDRPGAVRVVVRMVVEKATGYAAWTKGWRPRGAGAPGSEPGPSAVR
jgi:PPOX class probable F420-dependent enzyme